MRILHISYTIKAGAGKALLRHHRSLLKAGIDSHLLVAGPGIEPTEHIHRLERMGSVLNSKTKQKDLFCDRLAHNLEDYLGSIWFGNTSSLRITKSSLFKSADVVELRQLHTGPEPSYFNMRAVHKIARLKPLIWRLSDAWAFTGFCCYFFDCDGWKHGCFSCPFMKHPERTEIRVPKWNIAWRNLLIKQKYIRTSSMDVVSPSKWLLNEAKASLMNSGVKRFHFIPVGVDSDTFDGSGRMEERERLGIAPDDTVIVINAPNLRNYRKAGDLIVKTLQLMPNMSTTLLVIGRETPKGLNELFNRIIVTGYLNNDSLLAKAYAAADLFLFPSRQDNSAQVLLEAAASKLPVVCFDVGGNGEYVKNGKTGYVVPPFDCTAFARATIDLVQYVQLRKNFGERGRISVLNSFTMNHQTQSFIQLYNTVASRKS